MKTAYFLAPIGIVAALWLGFFFPSGDPLEASVGPADAGRGAPLVEVATPSGLSTQAQMGKLGFEAKCAVCHGTNAAGQDGVAPPLVHKTYEPSHHGDASFWLATQNGVRQHHWNFGNMPPVDGLTRADVQAITTYVRELQRENGIR